MNDELLHAIYRYVQEHPGCTQMDIRREFNLAYGDLLGRLATMEKIGLLLSEDSRGRFYVFEEA